MGQDFLAIFGSDVVVPGSKPIVEPASEAAGSASEAARGTSEAVGGASEAARGTSEAAGSAGEAACGAALSRAALPG